jgi:phage tail sheath protein FI
MATFNTPGVYIQEISTLPPSIAPVSTAIPAFIGYTQIGTTTPRKAVRITSMIEFVQNFGTAKNESFAVTVADTVVSSVLQNRTISVAFASPSGRNLYYSMQMYFANGGGPCYVVSVGSLTDAYDDQDFLDGFAAIAKEDEPTLLLFPDAVNLSPLSEYGTVYQAALTQCATLQDRFVIGDFIGDSTVSATVLAYRGVLGSNNLKYGAVYTPNLKTGLNYSYDEATTVSVSYSINGGTPVVGALSTFNTGGVNLNLQIYNQIIQAISTQHPVVVPPSSSMAGIYSAVDRDRGVWKAPANVSINLVSAPTIAITEAQQGDLNVDASTGKSINVIRAFTGRGILVWGSRTLAGNDNEWRYVPVRRLFIFAEESIKKASEFVVFEPNDKNTWLRVKSMISNFLTDLWRQGALTGDKPEQAYFVKIGLGETMTAQDILEGKLIIEVGLAAVRPAEFVILKFMHKMQEA